MRLMSVSLTEPQVRARTKTVTRRLGWLPGHVKVGDRVQLCRKVMGRRRPDGSVEPLERIAVVEIVSLRREPLAEITADDVVREGFPGWSPAEFVSFFVESMRCTPDTLVTRVEFRYVDSDPDRSALGGTSPSPAAESIGQLALFGGAP